MLVFEVDETWCRLGEEIPAGMVITSFNGGQGLMKKRWRAVLEQAPGCPLLHGCVGRAVVVFLVQTCAFEVSQKSRMMVLGRRVANLTDAPMLTDGLSVDDWSLDRDCSMACLPRSQTQMLQTAVLERGAGWFDRRCTPGPPFDQLKFSPGQAK